MSAARARSLVWIKEEGSDTPPPLAILAGRGWSTHVLGFRYDRFRRFRIGRWIRLFMAIGHVLSVRFGFRRATLVVGTHYAGLMAAILRSVKLPPRFGVVVHSVYAIPESQDRGILNWIVRTGLRRCDAVVVNSTHIARKLLAERLVSSPSRIFVLTDGPPPVVLTARHQARYAFSGGNSARDWDGLAAVVRASSLDVDWIIACPARVARRFSDVPRVRVLTDVPVDTFDALVAGASIVVAMLLQGPVAGVTLVRAAQAAGAVVIACGSSHLSEYVESGVDGVLARDIDDASQWVLKAWRDETTAAGFRQRALARAELDRREAQEANVKLADFLERVGASFGSAELQAV